MIHNQSTNLPSPKDIKSKYPLKNPDFVQEARKIAKKIFQGDDERLAFIIGPCSIHDEKQALIYSEELKKIFSSQKLFYPIMRVYCEKPRTALGWKGMLYDPHLDESYDFVEGIVRTRKLLVELANKHIPCATEFLDPLIVPYIDDLITWGFIGARTTASQPHRMFSSGLSFPVGFKNAVDGNTNVAAQGAFVSSKPHFYPGMDQEGRVSRLESIGNPSSHVVLRGANTFSNYDAESINSVFNLLKKYGLKQRIIIDCAHGNSEKCANKQKEVFKEIFLQIVEGNSSIMGIMLESNIYNGSQVLDDPQNLKYGVSITDPCISLEETEELLSWVNSQVIEKCLAL